mgnify:CR=1 FL=1
MATRFAEARFTAQEALQFHAQGKPGKLEITPTKPLTTQRDLSLGYSPGVAVPVRAIADDPATAYDYTNKGNLVAVVSNGTAILGLGNLGALAAKPVMEGKGVLFKRFADIDAIDLLVSTEEVDAFVNCVRYLGPSFGGINLEDIKAPDCFIIEEKLKGMLDIPVFHDDQHGTAIVVGAAILNGLEVAGKRIEDVKLACSGAGAAALACLNLLVSLGMKRENIFVSDIKGVVYEGRTELMDQWKAPFARNTKARTLAEIMIGADIFLGLSAGGIVNREMVSGMAAKPIIFAMANPEPEVTPEEVLAARDDAIMATGRSDYPNQVNNVLCFPFIFRGALDVGATGITEAMKVAAVDAIAELARAEASDVVASAYGSEQQSFGPEYLIPTPFDPRLIERIAPAVAKAAMESGVATRPMSDLEAYRQRLARYVYRSGPAMKPVLDAAKRQLKRVVFAEGEDERVLRAAQTLVDEKLGFPVLVGRDTVINHRIRQLGLRLEAGHSVEIIHGQASHQQQDVEREYFEQMKRRGVTMAMAREKMRSRPTLIAAMYLHRGYVDAMLCGMRGTFEEHLRYICEVIGEREGVTTLAAMNMLMLTDRQLFICDTYVNRNPTAEQIAEMTLLAAEEVRRFGMQPSVALLSHSSFGSSDSPEATKMRKAAQLLAELAPDLEVDGEMRGDAALMHPVLQQIFPDSKLKRDANLLIMPTLDAANISLTLLAAANDGHLIGPLLLGLSKQLHVLVPSATVRRIVNMTALSVAQLQA